MRAVVLAGLDDRHAGTRCRPRGRRRRLRAAASSGASGSGAGALLRRSRGPYRNGDGARECGHPERALIDCSLGFNGSGALRPSVTRVMRFAGTFVERLPLARGPADLDLLDPGRGAEADMDARRALAGEAVAAVHEAQLRAAAGGEAHLRADRSPVRLGRRPARSSTQ